MLQLLPRLAGRWLIAGLGFCTCIVGIDGATATPVYTKITASDAAANDRFGAEVAVSGNYGIVSASQNDDAGSNSGSAYVFRMDSGQQLFKLTASDAAAGDAFGSSVAISGNLALVGASQDDDSGANSGSAYLFDATTGNQFAKLTASDATAEDQFGTSVAISGNLALIGANGDGAGSAYLFDLNSRQPLFKLTAQDGYNGDQFGSSVSLTANRAIIGAPNDYIANYDYDAAGSAYVFDATTGQQIEKLVGDPASYDEDARFGTSVSTDGFHTLVGASGANYGGEFAVGKAYWFDTATGDLLFKWLGPAFSSSKSPSFGNSVAIEGDFSVVGIPRGTGAATFSGFVRIFDTITGQVKWGLTAYDGARFDSFGSAVAVSGNIVLIGAFGDSDAGSNSGSAYIWFPVPEPATAATLLIGVICTMSLRRRRYGRLSMIM